VKSGSLDSCCQLDAKNSLAWLAKNQVIDLKLGLETAASKAGLPDFSWYNIPKREKYTK
jgi:hypothetical protein